MYSLSKTLEYITKGDMFSVQVHLNIFSHNSTKGSNFVTCYYEALQKWKEINLKKEFALKKVNFFTKRV